MKGLDKNTYGPTSESFKHLVAQTLMEEEKPVRKRSFSVVLVTALLVLLLAATALAMVISAQDQKAAIQAAKDAVQVEYGFTEEDMALRFMGEAEMGLTGEGKEVWRVTLRPNLYFEKMGDYTVEVMPGTAEVVSVAWSHDGTNMAAVASGDWENEAWGPEQLRRLGEADDIIQEQLRVMEAELGPRDTWSLEDQARYSRFIMDLGHPKEDMFYNVMPGEDDIPLNEAIVLAYEMIEERYGTPRGTMEKFDYQVSFWMVKEWEERQWEFYFFPKAGEDAEALGEYRVRFMSPSKKIELCLWYVDDFWAAAPELLLKGKLDALYEKAYTTAFEELSAEEKATYFGALVEAGYDFSGRYDGVFCVPGEGELTEEEAVLAATEALREQEGFTDRAVSIFDIKPSFIRIDEEEPMWRVTFDPGYGYARVQTYKVTVNKEGEAVRVVSEPPLYIGSGMGEAYEGEGEPPLMQKQAWTPADIEAMLDLEAQAQAILDAGYDETGRLTMEARAAYDRLYRAAGYQDWAYPHDLPGEGDLTLEEAERLARKAIRDTYGVPEEILDFYTAYPEYQIVSQTVDYPVVPIWRFTFHDHRGGPEDRKSYIIELDAKTGEITFSYEYFGSNG